MRSKSRNGGRGFAPASRKLWLALSFIGIILLSAAPARPEVDLTSSVQVIRGSTYYDYARNQTYLSISLKNVSTHPLQAPVRLVIKSVTTPKVTVADPDGTTTDGKPYLDFSSQLANGELAPGKTSAARNLRFNNPSRLRFDFTTGVTGEMVNTPPTLSAINSFSVDEGKTLDVLISASDPDGDALTFSVASLPAFALFKDNRNGTATVSLAPGYQDAGNYSFGVSVTDGRLSSSAEAAFAVVDVNRPPRITSSPVTNAFEVTPYGYQVQAEDPDRDALRFSLPNAPEGMTIDPGTGLIFWNPVQMQIGVNDVTVVVSDARGGTDSQSYQVTVTATVDRTAPVVELVAPTQAQASTVLNLEVVARDNAEVTQVSFFVDGLHVEDKTVPPYRFAYNAPDEAGRTLTIRALAADAAGNQGEATARVAVVPAPDTLAPVIEAVSLPAAAAPGETVAVRAKVTDDRGVAAVRFSFQGNPFGSTTAPPYEVSFTVPASALPGSSLALDVAVEDMSQNLATVQTFLPIVATKDVDPPTNVSLTAPTEAVSGKPIQLSASALDNVGMMKIIFFADGVPFAEDPDAPYEAVFTLPESKPVGSKVVLVAQAVDFAGNRTNSATVYALVIAARTGFLVGEVYDDTTGLPVPGATVSAVVAGGKPLAEPAAATSDSRGRYRLLLAEGAAALEINKAGYTSSCRMETVQPKSVTTALNARITPVGNGSPIDRLNGGTVATGDQKISLNIPPGALGEDGSVTLTKLGVQALPAPLPPGWSPVCVIHAGPGTGGVNGTLQLAITGAENLGEGSRSGLNAAYWDSQARQWVRAQADALPDVDGLAITLSRLGTVALVKPDTTPAAPPTPVVGEALKGVTPQAIPDGVTAAILPSPKVLFMQPGAKSVVSAVLNNSQPLPSGTRLQVDFSEVYHKMDGTSLIPQSMTQDFALYQSATGFGSTFIASPSESFDPMFLKEGVITLSAHRPKGADGSGIIGPQGGVITSPGGLTLTVPPGALAAATPVSLTAISPADTGLEGDSRLLFLGGVALDFGDARLGVGAQLSVTLQTAPASDAQVLAVRPIRIEGATSFELVGIGSVSSSVVTVGQAANGLSLPGLLDGGTIYLVQTGEPVGYVTGSVQSGGAPLASGVVREDTLPLVSIPWGTQAQYVLASPLGLVSVTAKSLTDGSKATGTATLATRDQIVPLDLALAPARPTVVSVSPANGATGVQTSASLAVRFSQAMDQASFNTSSFALLDGAAAVQGTITLQPDGLTALFQPGTMLRNGASYQVSLSAAIRDTYGQQLSGNQPDGSFLAGFTTRSNTPPPLPPAGQITLSIPAAGMTEARGTQGTLIPGTIIHIYNATQQISTASMAGDDGSFFATVAAQPGDVLQLSILDVEGNSVALPSVPFSDGKGTTILGPLGGEMCTKDGVHASLLPKALVNTVSVKLTDIPLTDFMGTLPSSLTPVKAFHVDLPAGSFNKVQKLELKETGGQFPDAATLTTPFRSSVAYVTAGTTGSSNHFEFLARSTDSQGRQLAVSLPTYGSASTCVGQNTSVEQHSSAPSLQLSAPLCLGPSQTFTLQAAAVQPRLDVWISAPEGAKDGDLFLIVSKVVLGGSSFWSVEEVAMCTSSPNGLRVLTSSQAPWGIRNSGDYIIVKADTPLVMVEGFLAGDRTVAGSNLLPLVAISQENNGGFLLPVPADTAFELQTRSLSDGTLLSSISNAPIPYGSTRQLGEVGNTQQSPLSVAVSPTPGQPLSPNASIEFSFNEKIVAHTVDPSNIMISDSKGRSIGGEFALTSNGVRVFFSPTSAWKMGEVYSYRVTPRVMAESGAHLSSDVTGTFSAFVPGIVGSVSGSDVKDAVAVGTTAYLLDGASLRAVDILNPAQPVEGNSSGTSSTPNRISSIKLDSDGANRTGLLIDSGSTTDYGKLNLFTLEAPLGPSPVGSIFLSTPAGGPVLENVLNRPGIPDALAVGENWIVVSNRGIGLQRLSFDTLLTAGDNGKPGDALKPYPSEGGVSYTDVATLDNLLVSITKDTLRLHDPESLTPISEVAVSGTPADLELVRVKERTLALVAAGLTGGVQVYEIEAGGTPGLIAQIMPGCAAARVTADGPMNRAWLWCSNQRLWSLDLSNVDGTYEIDEDGDGVDDRLGGSIYLPVPLKSFALDSPRSLALVSGGTTGLHIVQLGPVEAVITGVRREPIAGRADLSEAVLQSGRVYSGDDKLVMTIETRIPPGHPSLRAVIECEGTVRPVTFPGEVIEQELSAGTNELVLKPALLQGAQPVSFVVKVIDSGNNNFGSYAAALYPVSVNSIISARPAQPTYTLETTDPLQITIIGRSADGRFYNLTPLVNCTASSLGVVSAAPGGTLQGIGGGETQVSCSIGKRSAGQFDVISKLPPVITGLEVDPVEIRLRAPGQSTTFLLNGIYSDGSRKTLTAASGVTLSSSDSSIASVDFAGRITAGAEGDCVITAGINSATVSVYVAVNYYVTPNLSAIKLDLDKTEEYTDKGMLPVNALIAGTGSLDGLTVTFQVNGVGDGSAQFQAVTSSIGLANTVISGLSRAGIGELVATVLNPATGTILSDTVPITIIERNRDGEPNGTLQSATRLSLNGALSGHVAEAVDPVDVYSIESTHEGTLAVVLSRSDAGTSPMTLTVMDASGNRIAEESSTSRELSINTPIPASSLYIAVSCQTGAVGYSLSNRLKPAAPQIDSILPASGRPGEIVNIYGNGFDTFARSNTVKFNGIVTEVLTAHSDNLQVYVPAFATDGPVTVSSGGSSSNPFFFSIGSQGDPTAEYFFKPADPSHMVEDPFTENSIIDNRILVRFKPFVTRTAVENIVKDISGVIVGLNPVLNIYRVEFGNISGIDDLYSILDTISTFSEAMYALPCLISTPASFPVVTRDRLTPRKGGAYRQIQLFEAWNSIINSGYFSSEFMLASVQVGIMDKEFFTNKYSRAALDSNTFVRTSVLLAETSDNSSHSVGCASIIGALRSDPVDDVDIPNGILGGVVAPDMSPFYKIMLFECDMLTDAFEEFTLTMDRSAESIDIWNLSFGGIYNYDNISPSALEKHRTLNPGVSDSDLLNSLKIKTKDLFNKSKQHWMDIIKTHLSKNSKALFVCAVGNENIDAKYSLPSALSVSDGDDTDLSNHIIAVAAVGQGLNNKDGGTVTQKMVSKMYNKIAIGTPFDLGADTRAAFSNYGDAVDVAAPGIAVYTVDRTRKGTDRGISLFNGTSAAAPMVAGVAALLKSLDPDLDGPALKERIIATASPIGKVYIPTTFNELRYGHPFDWGDWTEPKRLNALAAVQETLAKRKAPRVPGDKHYVWFLDSRHYWPDKDVTTNQLIRLDIDNSTSAPEQLDLEEVGKCVYPTDLLVLPSGDKLYITCRESNSVLIYNANTKAASSSGHSSDTEHSKRIDLEEDLAAIGTKMAISPDGHYLFVPLQGMKIAVIDTWQEMFLGSLLFPSVGGEIQATAFDSKLNLFVLSAQQGGSVTGTIFKVLRQNWLVVADKFTSAGYVAGEGDWEPPIHASRELTLSNPSGITIQKWTDDNGNEHEYVYVYYSRYRGNANASNTNSENILATVYASENLEKYPGEVTYNIAGKLSKHENMVPGGFISIMDKLRYTAIENPVAMAIDHNSENRGYVSFFDTGNIGLLSTNSEGRFNEMKAVTRVNGSSTTVTKPFEVVLQYLPDEFPIAMELDQEGERLATAFVGMKSHIRMFSAGKMEAVFGRVEWWLEDPLVTPLEDIDSSIWYDIGMGMARDIPMYDPRAVVFEPQLSIITPQNGQVVGGAIPVNVIWRDKNISKLEFILCDNNDPAISFKHIKTEFTEDEKEKGVFLSRKMFEVLDEDGKREYYYDAPHLVISNSEWSGSLVKDHYYTLKVIGTKSNGNKVTDRVSFKYKP